MINLELLFNALPTPCILLMSDAPRFTIIGVNKAYCIATKTPEYDLINKGIFEAFPDNSNDAKGSPVNNLKASLELVIATKASQIIDIQHYDIPLRGTSGFELRYWRAENTPVLNERAEIDYIIHSVTDITEKITESEAKYRSLIESSMDGILLTVKEGQILGANRAACEIFKMTHEEICNAGRTGLVDITDPRLQPLLEERSRTGKASGELTFKRKDGSRFSGEITSVVFTDAHGGERTSMTIRDITERKLADHKLTVTSNALKQTLHDLNRIMDSSLDIICSFDEEGRFVNVSAASEAILGYRPQELTGRNFIDFVFPEDVLNTTLVGSEIMNGVPVTMFENRYTHKEGRVVPILWSARWDEKDKLMYCIAKDATEKKRLEKSFEIERQSLQDLYAQAPSCMGIIKGPNHIYELANPLYLKLIGKSDIIGKTVKEVLPELEAQGIFEFLDTVYKTGQTFSANEMLVKFDLQGTGELSDTYLNFIYQAHRNTEGSIDGIFFFAIDVTEQVSSRKKIEENKKNYEELIRELPVAAYSCDAEGRILIYNKAAAELWGREPEIGNDLWCGSWKIYSTDGDLIPHESSAMAGALKEGRVINHKEIIIERPNGDKRNVIPHPVPLIDSSGRITGAVNMLTDITEQKAAETALRLREQRFKTLVQEGYDLISIVDENRNYTYLSPAYTSILGIKYEELIGTTPFGRIHKDDLESVNQTSARLVNEKRVKYLPFRYRVGKGEYRWLETIATNLLDDPSIQGILFNSNDITNRMNYIQAIEEQNIKLREIAWIQSHLVRAPVARILGLIDLIKNYKESINEAELLNNIYESAQEIDLLIKDIVDKTQKIDAFDRQK